MEKYGVEEDIEVVKTATDKTKRPGADTCPSCGALLRDRTSTGVLLCPNCGSKPFEKSSNEK